MADPERLFRDAEGAALERVARLEDDNRRLRLEVARLTSYTDADADASAGEENPGADKSALPSDERRRAPVRVRPGACGHPFPGRMIVMAMALPLGMLSLLLSISPSACPSTRAHLRSSAFAEAHAPRSLDVSPYVGPVDPLPIHVMQVTPVDDTDPGRTSFTARCSRPYRVDERGQRHVNRACVE